jgi:hypothetical protein
VPPDGVWAQWVSLGPRLVNLRSSQIRASEVLNVIEGVPFAVGLGCGDGDESGGVHEPGDGEHGDSLLVDAGPAADGLAGVSDLVI